MAKKRASNNSSRELTLELRDGLEYMAADVLVELRVDQQLATVFLDSYESSCINLLDPTDLEFEYMQQMTAACQAFIPPGPIEALHLGGCACALPLAWHHLRDGSTQTVVELNGPLAHSMRELFDLPRAPHLKIRVDEAYSALSSMRPNRFDVIVRDVFDGARTPKPLRSVQFFERAKEVVRPGGLVLVNCVHGRGVDARGDCASALSVFDDVAVVSEGKVLSGGRRGNVVIVCYKKPVDQGAAHEDLWLEFQRNLRRLSIPSKYLTRRQVERWIGTTKPIDLADSKTHKTTV